MFNDSAVHATCHDGYVSYSQTWPIGIDCNAKGNIGMPHKDFNKACKQGFPSEVYTTILDFSGCLKQGFSPNVTNATAAYCSNKCDDEQLCGDPVGQTCSELVNEYSCERYYCPTCQWAGWCDQQCGFGSCNQTQSV